MESMYVQFSDAIQSKIVAEFGGPQSDKDYPHQGTVTADDPRLLAFRGRDAGAALRAQIVSLEAQQTPRRIREAALGIDNGWLADLEAQIDALRAQLGS